MKQLSKSLAAAESLHFIHELYDKVSSGFTDFVVAGGPSRPPEDVRQELHKLRNRYRNLGMARCAELTKSLEDLVVSESRDDDAEAKFFKELKNSNFLTLNLFFENFLP